MIIKIKVIPNAKEEKIEIVGDGEYKIKVRAPAIDGRANERVIEIISEHFGVAKRNIIIKNPLSRQKIVEIKNPVAAKL